jgi:hypothetical protein
MHRLNAISAHSAALMVAVSLGYGPDQIMSGNFGPPTQPVKPSKFTQRRNDPCPCKSGKKFKNCCKDK